MLLFTIWSSQCTLIDLDNFLDFSKENEKQLTCNSPAGFLHLVSVLGDVVDNYITFHQFTKKLLPVWVLQTQHVS